MSIAILRQLGKSQGVIHRFIMLSKGGDIISAIYFKSCIDKSEVWKNNSFISENIMEISRGIIEAKMETFDICRKN